MNMQNKIENDINKPTELDFFRFVYERQLIWYKRFILKQNRPWTKDQTLQRYKIINMYRELDKCTIYLVNKLKDIKDRKSVLINVIFYRFFNLYNLYEDLNIPPFNEINDELKFELIKRFNNLKESRPIFNNAYLISSGGRGIKHINVLENLANLDLNKLIEDIDNSKTTEESFSYIIKIPMVGPFLACEIWTDLTYFNWFKLGWNDNDFVNIGPGAKWGLEILYGKISKKELRIKLYQLRDMQRKIFSKFEDEIPWEKIAFKEASSNYPYLSITNIEGALCEFRKYWRISHGEGRRKYFVPFEIKFDMITNKDLFF
ncbi:hypothetical protein J4216_02715 [Candidatus Woesearchaeota archaeon]|nr:hypothetical protein [Candidatus Woesearchaeota archaeon]